MTAAKLTLRRDIRLEERARTPATFALPALSRVEWIFLGLTALLLALSVAVRPINHDEGQYVAATALMRLGLPYRDFAYLQTPLQPLLLSPLAFVPAGWLLVASRLANALCAWIALLLIAHAARRSAPPWAAGVAAAGLACTDAFLFAASLARNDALPMVLLAGAVAVLVAAVESQRTRTTLFFAGGLMLGLAASAKISFALPAAGAGLFMLLTGQRRDSLSFFVAGGVAGVSPSLVMAALEPQRFFFGVFTYSLAAPQQWWSTTIGHPHALDFAGKVANLFGDAQRGVILPALLAALIDRRRNTVCFFLDLMVVGALIGAYLPDPSFPQYLAPLLPPLFVRLAIALGSLRYSWRWLVVAGVVAGSVYGLTRTVKYLSRNVQQGFMLGHAVQQGRLTAQLLRGGTLVTLSPERAAGSDVILDRGFVTGPFLFRTHGWVADEAWRLGFSPNWQRLAHLERNPPRAILVGGEWKRRPPLHPHGLDAHLVKWARVRGYRPVRMPGRGFTLFLRPE